jgi:predicted cytidylate kinase
MKITVSGQSGSGSTSFAKALAHELGYLFYSTGNIYREMAKELDMSIQEFDATLEEHAKYDSEMDRRQQEFGMAHDNFVIDSRMGWHLIPDSFKILVTAPDEQRIERIMKKESLSAEDAKKSETAREALHAKRFLEMYAAVSLPIIGRTVVMTSLGGRRVIPTRSSYQK